MVATPEPRAQDPEPLGAALPRTEPLPAEGTWFLAKANLQLLIDQLRADGRIVLVTVGGRQPYHSLGMTLAELAAYLRQLGATDALNLDGGGSTTLVVRGTVVNLPSDETGERPVSDVLLVLAPGTGAP